MCRINSKPRVTDWFYKLPKQDVTPSLRLDKINKMTISVVETNHANVSENGRRQHSVLRRRRRACSDEESIRKMYGLYVSCD